MLHMSIICGNWATKHQETPKVTWVPTIVLPAPFYKGSLIPPDDKGPPFLPDGDPFLCLLISWYKESKVIRQQSSMKARGNSCCIPSRSMLPLEAKTLRLTKPKVAEKRSINSTRGLLGVMVGRGPAPATPEFSEQLILPSGDMATAHEWI